VPFRRIRSITKRHFSLQSKSQTFPSSNLSFQNFLLVFKTMFWTQKEATPLNPANKTAHDSYLSPMQQPLMSSPVHHAIEPSTKTTS
jgi:hypothetical protein